MMAGLDEATAGILVAVLLGGGVLALLAAWMLWRRERAGVAASGAGVAGEGPVVEWAPMPDHAADPVAGVAATLPLERVIRDAELQPMPAMPVARDAQSDGGMSRVELFGRGASFARQELAEKVAAVDVAPPVAPLEVPVRAETVAHGARPVVPIESEIVVTDGFVPAVVREPDPVAEARDAPAVQPAARRRPKTASELAEAGQTPDGLLSKAHELLAAGAHEEAAVQLRACARLASRLKEPAIEAVARLELGDLCQSSGDMTTACEHWQIARSLYAEMKQMTEKTGVIKRMEKAGCPTDWVLTKF